MAERRPNYGTPRTTSDTSSTRGGIGGVCMMRKAWREEQHPLFIQFISSFLQDNSFRLNFVPIEPDFIFNCGGLSVAFVFVTSWDTNLISSVFSRIQKLKGQFRHFYVVVTLPTREQNDSFTRSYFKYGMELGKPTFVPVQDLEMGFEKIVNIAHARGVCKQQDAIARLKVEVSSTVDLLYQAIGSIKAISKATKDQILEKTDLSAEKAERITTFFRDPNYYLSVKIN